MRNDREGGRKATPRETLANLAAFLDEDPRNVTDEELDAFMAEAGIDFNSFNARLSSDLDAAKKLQRNRTSAMAAAKGFKLGNALALTIEEMRRALIQEGHLVAARANESLADEDIETIYRLTHPEEVDERNH